MKRSEKIAAAREYLGLNRNVAVLAVSVFGLGLGEELWQAYVPKYLMSLGASTVIVGVFASWTDLLDALYQYPGGWVNDKFGRKRALTLFTILAMAGYAVYALATHWTVAFVGVGLVMAWKSGAFPATFAVIGDSLPHGKRAIGFSVQSILVRVPRVLGGPLGGLLIAAFGVALGIRVALGITLILALGVLATQRRAYKEKKEAAEQYVGLATSRIFFQMRGGLKRLLLADTLVRIGEGIAEAFIVLYVLNVLRISAPKYGVLYAIQYAVAISLYVPAGKLAERVGRKSLVALTFLFFALFPLVVGLSSGFAALVLGFVTGGLKELGEPARKSMIVDLSDPAQRGRTVGVYYTIRNLLVVPTGAIGGLLWQRSPQLPLETGFCVAIAGTLAYLAMSGGIHEMGNA